MNVPHIVYSQYLGMSDTDLSHLLDYSGPLRNVLPRISDENLSLRRKISEAVEEDDVKTVKLLINEYENENLRESLQGMKSFPTSIPMFDLLRVIGGNIHYIDTLSWCLQEGPHDDEYTHSTKLALIHHVLRYCDALSVISTLGRYFNENITTLARHYTVPSKGQKITNLRVRIDTLIEKAPQLRNGLFWTQLIWTALNIGSMTLLRKLVENKPRSTSDSSIMEVYRLWAQLAQESTTEPIYITETDMDVILSGYRLG